MKISEFIIGPSENKIKIFTLSTDFNKNNILVLQHHPFKDRFKYYFIDNKLIFERIDEESGWNHNHKAWYHETEIEATDNNRVIEFNIGNSLGINEKKIILDKYFYNNIFVKRESFYNDTFNFNLINNELFIKRIDLNEGWLYDTKGIIYDNNIPKNIYICYKTKNIPEYILSNIKNLNPSYKIFLYDDSDIINFLYKYYDQNYVDLFNFLQDGAIKADFWRVCVLYKLGGVYMDIDVELFESIDNFMENGVTFLSCISSFENDTNPHFIISHAGNIILAKCIEYYFEKYRSNVPYGYWTYSIVYIMARSIADIFGYYLRDEGLYSDGNYCNKYQFLKEIRDPDYSNWHCDYNNRRILNNRRKDYKIAY